MLISRSLRLSTTTSSIPCLHEKSISSGKTLYLWNHLHNLRAFREIKKKYEWRACEVANRLAGIVVADETDRVRDSLYEFLIFRDLLCQRNASCFESLCQIKSAADSSFMVHDVMAARLASVCGSKVFRERPIHAKTERITIHWAAKEASKIIGRNGCNTRSNRIVIFCETNCSVLLEFFLRAVSSTTEELLEDSKKKREKVSLRQRWPLSECPAPIFKIRIRLFRENRLSVDKKLGFPENFYFSFQLWSIVCIRRERTF